MMKLSSPLENKWGICFIPHAGYVVNKNGLFVTESEPCHEIHVFLIRNHFISNLVLGKS